MFIICLLAFVLAGCASSPQCGAVASRAHAAADERLPLGAWIDEIDRSCRAAATEAWATRLAQDCAPLYGFHAGTREQVLPSRCQVNEVTAAWNMGHEIASMQRELSDIKLRLAEGRITPDQRRELRARQVTIERDLPQLRALARMEGWLTPAELRDPWLKLPDIL
ncbi:MAG: hypothetical protein RQ729_01845 [Wenzhouxiangellaceae bacterium]|nr:hypothetical protein [Wenzhouxiangellaceae bacterium]